LDVKKNLKIFYTNIGLKYSYGLYYKHLFVFAITFTDRFISRIDPNKYQFQDRWTYQDKSFFSTGGMMVFSHFGGWAMSANSIKTDKNIHIVKSEAIKSGISQIEKNLKTQNQYNTIDIKDGNISNMITISNALLNDDIVVMMADRPHNDKQKAKQKFFGIDAYWNKAPFDIAYKLKKSLIVYFVVYIKKQNYKMIRQNITYNYDIEKEQAIADAIQQYIKIYEQVVTKYPTNWLNLYNFWQGVKI
jgi:predicted LPLAT superfamily acyltransferase